MKYLHLETLLDRATEKLIYVVLASLLFYIFYRLLRRMIKHLFDRYSRINIVDSTRVLTLSRLTLSVFQYLTVFLYIYTILGIFGLPVASLLAGAGIVGVGLGFAGRDLMTDIINGFFIIIEHQVNVGDIVSFKNLDITGTVTVIGIRSLTLKGTNGALIFVPNRNITALANLSRLDQQVFLDVPVTVETMSEFKKRMLLVNKNYPNAEFVGVQIVDEKVYLRTKLSGSYLDISAQKAELLTRYYQIED